MSIAPYKTLMKRASDSFIVNKSRFIGHGAPVESEEEALGFLAEMRREYQDASHNCYAYIIGTNMGIMRYNDDGEPGGTAGMPIIEVLKARGVTNCCVVVTRYFGGVLLGDGDADGLFQGHDQLHGSQRIGAQIVSQRSGGGHGFGVAAQSLDNNVTHFFKFHDISPCFGESRLLLVKNIYLK